MSNNTNKFGTISWAVQYSIACQSRAIAAINKRKSGLTKMQGLKPVTKRYLSLITGCTYNTASGNFAKVAGKSAKRGYMLMTDSEYMYAIGMISADRVVMSGKKMIVAADVTIYGKLTLVPVR